MSIEETIKRYIAENMLFSDSRYAYPDDASFMEEGVLDSLGVLELALFVEENYGFRPSQQEMTPQNFDSVVNLATYIRRNMFVSS
jgi:acyl carrier protein